MRSRSVYGSAEQGWPTDKRVLLTTGKDYGHTGYGQRQYQHEQGADPKWSRKLCKQCTHLTKRTSLGDGGIIGGRSGMLLAMSEGMYHIARQHVKHHCEEQYPCGYVAKAAHWIGRGANITQQ